MTIEEEVMKIQKKLNKISTNGSVGDIHCYTLIRMPIIHFNQF